MRLPKWDGIGFYTPIPGGRMVLDAEQYAIASADSTAYSNAGLDSAAAAAVFTATMGCSANGALTVEAAKAYAFEFMYTLINTGTTSHTWAVLMGGTATFTAFHMQLFSGGGITTGAPVVANGGFSGAVFGTDFTFGGAGTVVSAASTSATEQLTVQGLGVFTVNAAGTIIPQMKASARPGASGVANVTVKRGSFFRAWRLAAGTVGPWS